MVFISNFDTLIRKMRKQNSRDYNTIVTKIIDFL